MDGHYFIRPMHQNAEDLQAVARLGQNRTQLDGTTTLFHYCDPPRRGADPLALVCEERRTGRIIGTVSASIRSALFYPETNGFENVACLFGPCVERAHRRRGVATHLINEIRKILVAKDVTFVYTCISERKTSIQRLYLKLNYKPLWSTSFSSINIGHMVRILADEKAKENVSTQKLGIEESEAYIREKCAEIFLLPSRWHPTGSTVYFAKKDDENELGFAVFKHPNVWMFTCDSLWCRFVRAFKALLSYFLPCYIECPLPFAKQCIVHVASPICVDLCDRSSFQSLLEALLPFMIRDLEEASDVLIILVDAMLGDDFRKVVRSCRYISPGLFQGEHVNVFATSIKPDPVEAEEMDNCAQKHRLWFPDAKDFF